MRSPWSSHRYAAQGHDRSPERVHARVDAVLLKKYGWEIPAHLPQHQQEQLAAMHDRWQATLATSGDHQPGLSRLGE